MSYKLDEITILIVEDTPPMLILAQSLLRILGFKDIILAKTGKEGYDLFVRHNPDIVITDWFMEPMNGVELAKKIRHNEDSPNREVPIIMMTGYASKHRVEEARDIGITEFLIKPYSAKDLYNKILQLIEKPRPFIEAEDFFGPDRRRRADEYEGPKRRADDNEGQKEERVKESNNS